MPEFVRKDFENAIQSYAKIDLFVKKLVEYIIEKNPDYTKENVRYVLTSVLNDCIDNNLEEQLPTYRSLEECKKWAKENKIRTKEQWEKCWKKGKLPKDIPRFPHIVYGEKNYWKI